MSDETREVSITVKASQAITALTQVGSGLSQMNALVGQSDKQLAQTETRLQNYGQKLNLAKKSVQDLKDANTGLTGVVAALNKQILQQDTALTEMAERLRVASTELRSLQEYQQSTVGRTSAMTNAFVQNTRSMASNGAAVGLFKNNLSNFQTTAQATTSSVGRLVGSMNLPGVTKATTGYNQQRESLERLTGSFRVLTPQAVGWNSASTSALASTKDWQHSMNSFGQQNVALRYALYSVATTFGLMSAAGIKAYADLFGAGINFQKNIAGVLRTSQVETPSTFAASPLVLGGIITQEQQAQLATQSLTNAFLDLQSSIPISQQDLTTIGTLGSQMGIAAADIANFTQVTAEFAATTGIDASTAATGLARIAQLLPDLQGNYQGLASAILKTGVNSIATEAQIVQSTQNIASVGRVAGLSGTQVIALASGMSSLGITSELQRSTVTQSFTKILTAVQEGSGAAEKFGSVLGLTGKQFQDAWGKDPYKVFIQLTNAIASSKGGVQTLADLGLASQRLTPTLLKIGQNSKVFAESLSDTNKGMKQSTELNRQFQIIATTTAARVQVLSQAWDKFLVIIGSVATDTIGNLAKGITDALNVVAKFAESPIGQVISNIVIVVGLLGVAILSVATVVTLATASLLGLGYVIEQLNVTALEGAAGQGLLGFAIDGTAASALLASGKMAVLSGASSALKGALSALISPAGLAAIALIGVGVAVAHASDIQNFTNELQGLPSSISGLEKTLGGKGFASFAAFSHSIGDSNLPEWLVQLDRSLGKFGGGDAFGDIRDLDEQLAKFAATNGPAADKQLEKLQEQWVASGQKLSTFKDAFPDTIAALDLQAGKAGASTKALKAYYATQADGEDAAQKAAIRTQEQADALGLVSDAYTTAANARKAYISSLQSAGSNSIDVTTDIGDAFGTGKGKGGGLAQLQTTLSSQLGAYQTWAAGIQKLTAEGAGATAQAFIAAGPSSQAAVTAALKLSPTGLASLEVNMREAAFYASAAYANTFADQNAILADVYKKVLAVDPSQVQNALAEAITDLGAGNNLTPAQAANLQKKYGITLNLKLDAGTSQADIKQYLLDAQAIATARPIIVPTKLGALPSPTSTLPGSGIGATPKNSTEYSVTEGNHSILLTVAPDTAAGTKTLDAWRKNQYKVPASLQVNVDTGAASNAINKLKTKIQSLGSNFTLSYHPGVGGNPNYARGGQIKGYANGGMPAGQFRGPGTGTSDSILAAVSTGEWISTARAVSHYGTGMFDAINRLQFPKFASGGSVGGYSGGGGDGASMAVTVIQNYPTTQDPIKKLKEDAANVVAGIW